MTAILAKYRNSILAAILAAILAGCIEYPTLPVSTTTPASSETASPVPTRTAEPTATPRTTAYVLPDVLSVRDADGIVRDWLTAGQAVTVIECKDNWCRVSTDVLTGYVFGGCLSGHPAELGCKEAK